MSSGLITTASAQHNRLPGLCRLAHTASEACMQSAQPTALIYEKHSNMAHLILDRVSKMGLLAVFFTSLGD